MSKRTGGCARSALLAIALAAAPPVPLAVAQSGESEAGDVASGTYRVFENPSFEGHRLDWATDCGLAAAAFCGYNDFTRTLAFEMAPDIGAADPTLTLGSRQLCDQAFCDGFASITCAEPLAATRADTGKDTTASPAGDGDAAAHLATLSPPTETQVFDGRSLGGDWKPISASGGNFDAFAVLRDGALRVDVPQGNGWGKTGIRSISRIVPVPGSGDGDTVAVSTVRFAFDPAATSAMVIALASGNEDDAWWSHDLRAQFWRDEESGEFRLTVWVERTEVGHVLVGPEPPKAVLVSVYGDGSARVSVPDSGKGVTVRMPDRAGTAGWYVFAQAHPVLEGLAARMALSGIWLGRGEVPAAGPSPYPPAQDETLFADRLGGNWSVYAIGGNFWDAAELGDDGLRLSVSGGAQIGVFSPEPVVWLDDFGPGAEIAVDVQLDGRTDAGFSVFLSMQLLQADQMPDPGDPALGFRWRPEPGGGRSAALIREDEELWTAPLGRAPERLRLVLRPGALGLVLDGDEVATADWQYLVAGAGFRLRVAAGMGEADGTGHFGLKRIALHRTPAPLAEEKPAPGVEPLPGRVLFEGAANALWEPASAAGGDFATHARYAGGALVVDVPQGHGWAKAGLLSANPILSLKPGLTTRLSVEFAPDPPPSVSVLIAGYKTPDMWNDRSAGFILARAPNGNVMMGVDTAYWQHWYREVRADWLRDHWDGTLLLDLTEGTARMALPAGPVVQGSVSLGAGAGYFAKVATTAPASDAAAAMVLKRIRIGRPTPPGMTAAERWRYLEDDEFDPSAFLEEIASQF